MCSLIVVHTLHIRMGPPKTWRKGGRSYLSVWGFFCSHPDSPRRDRLGVVLTVTSDMGIQEGKGTERLAHMMDCVHRGFTMSLTTDANSWTRTLMSDSLNVRRVDERNTPRSDDRRETRVGQNEPGQIGNHSNIHFSRVRPCVLGWIRDRYVSLWCLVKVV